MRNKAEIIGLIEETVAYYGSDPVGRRAIDRDTNICMYVTDDDRHCAVGRCFNDTGMEKYGDARASYDTLLGMKQDLNEYFKDQYKGFSNDTWRNLQTLHDTNEFWGESGLSGKGGAYVDALIELAEDDEDLILNRHNYI